MAARSGYILCGTPRTGSTLLCSLLSSTGVLGHPDSYFREPDEAAWAKRLDVPVSGDGVPDFQHFTRAVQKVATTDNGVFAARIMWGSLERVVEGLQTTSEQSDLTALEAFFGTLAFVHLTRADVVGQAVSWARAEQTSYWQQGDVALRPPGPDLLQMKYLVDTIVEHNMAWQMWFGRNAIEPLRLTYEELVRDPRRSVEGIPAELEVALPPTWQPVSPHRKQADSTNEEWRAMLRDALTGEVE